MGIRNIKSTMSLFIYIIIHLKVCFYNFAIPWMWYTECLFIVYADMIKKKCVNSVNAIFELIEYLKCSGYIIVLQ